MKQQFNLLPSGKDYVKKTFLTVCVNIPCLPNSVKRVLGKQGILMFHSMRLQCLKNIFKVRYIVFKCVKHNLQIHIAVVMNDSVAQARNVAPGHR